MSRQGTSYGGAYAMPDGEVAEAHHQSDPRPPAYASPTSRPRPALRTPMRPSRGADTKPTPSLHQACPKPMRRLRGADSKPAPRLSPTHAPLIGRKAAKCALRARGACPECAPLAGRARPARTSSGRTKETSPLWATPLSWPPDHCRRTSGSCTQVPGYPGQSGFDTSMSLDCGLDFLRLRPWWR